MCVPVCEKEFSALRNACERASRWADIIELRVDCLEANSKDLSALLSEISHPVILTFRPSEQGGYRSLKREERLGFWKSQAPRGDDVTALACSSPGEGR